MSRQIGSQRNRSRTRRRRVCLAKLGNPERPRCAKHMKTVIQVVIVGLLAAGCAHTDRFALVDRVTGDECGPLAYRDGATVRINNRDYTLKKLPSRGKVMETRLRSKIIPEVYFCEADIQDVVEFFREVQVEDADSAQTNPVIQINTVLPPDRGDKLPKVTMQARMISEYDALRTVAESTGLSLTIDDSGIWLKKDQ